MASLTIGTAQARPGQIVCGWLDGVELPTGGADRFPVIVAQGRHDGPLFWVTASIHGGEHTGLIAAQQLATPDLVQKLRGTLVIVPTLNPAGLRTRERAAYYHSGDPNRLFPERPRQQNLEAAGEPDRLPSALEMAYRRLTDVIAATGAAALLDLHNAQIGSLPMVFRDPVLFHRSRARGLTRGQAQALNTRVESLLEAFGFSIINEYVAESYVTRGLHRSLSGAVLNGLGIPAATVELGSWLHVEPEIVQGCLIGLRNALRWAGMLDGDYEPQNNLPVIRPGYPVRRHPHPHAPQAGIAQPLVPPGQPVEIGQPLARLTDIFGQPLGPDDGLLRSEYDGFVLAWQHGVVRYQNEAIMVLAIPDSSEMVIAYPY